MNMKLEDNTFQCFAISQSQVQQVSQLIHKSFMAFDPIYQKYVKRDNDQVIMEETRIYVIESIKQNLAFGLRLKPSNKIVGANLACDITTLHQIYAKCPSNQESQKYWNHFKIYKQLQKILMNLKDFKKGKATYNIQLAIDPQFVLNYSLGPLCLSFAIRRVFDMGFENVYAIAYNPISIKMITTFGGKILTKLKHEQLNLDFCLIEATYSDDAYMKMYIQMNKQKTLKQMIKKSLNKTIKSKL